MNFLKKPESELVIFGELKFTSDLPKKCFRYTFDAKKKQKIDYFTCKTCSLNCKTYETYSIPESICFKTLF